MGAQTSCDAHDCCTPTARLTGRGEAAGGPGRDEPVEWDGMGAMEAVVGAEDVPMPLPPPLSRPLRAPKPLEADGAVHEAAPEGAGPSAASRPAGSEEAAERQVLRGLREGLSRSGCAGWTHAAVCFEGRADGSEEPLLVPKDYIVSGKSCKTAFQLRQPGTTVFTAGSLYIGSVMVVKVATRGKIVESRTGMEKADVAPPLEIEDDLGNDFASHFVRLHTDKNGKRMFDPPRLRVLSGQVISFSWRAEAKPLQLLQTDHTFSPEANITKSGVQILEICDRGCKVKIDSDDKGERICFVCDGYPEDARMQITVVSDCVAGAFRIIWQVVAWVFAGVLLGVFATAAVDYIKNSSFVTAFFDCQGVNAYCEGPLLLLKDDFFDTAAVPFFCAAAIIVTRIPAAIITLVWPAPKLSSFGQGFRQDVMFFLRLASAGFLVLPFSFVLADWIMLSKYSWGVTNLFHTFGNFVQTILDDLLVIITSAERLLQVAASMEEAGFGSVPDASVLDSILEYESQVRGYTQLGVDLLATIVFVRLALSFITLLCVVVCLSYGVAGLVRRSPECLHTSSQASIVALAFVLWLLGYSAFFHDLWLDTYTTYLSVDGVVTLSGEGTQPLAVTLLSGCSANSQATIPIAALTAPLTSVLGNLGAATLTNFADAPVSAEDVQRFAQEVEVQLESLQHWMSQKDARPEEFGMGLVEGVTTEQFAQALEGGILILRVLLDAVECKQIGPFLSDTQRRLDREILPPSWGVVYVEYALAIVLLFWVILARVTSFVFLRPHKIYHDKVSRRWFRFKYCYHVSVKLRKASVGRRFHAHRVQRHVWNVLAFFDGVLLLNTVMTAVLFTGGVMLLLLDASLNPTWQWANAGAGLLITSSMLGFAGAWKELGAWRNKALRVAGVLALATATGCLAYSATDTAFRQLECIEKVGYDPTRVGPTEQMAFEMTRAATESANGWTLDVTGQGLSEGDGLALIKGLDSCPPAEGDPLDAQSLGATSFGRRHPFQTALGSGIFGLCWCPVSSGCQHAEDYNIFAGHLYVDQHVDRFDTCTLEVLAGMSQGGLAITVIIPFCLLRIVLGTATLLHCVYSAHITDRQRLVAQTVGGENSTNLDDFKGTRSKPDLRRLKPWWLRLKWFHWVLAFCVLASWASGIVFLLVISQEPDTQCYAIRGCSAEAPPVIAETPTLQSCPTCCNLQEATCGKRVDQAAFATVHNAMSSKELQWNFPNNLADWRKSLSAGVRGLMFDLHYRWPPNASSDDLAGPGAVYLCHGYCGFGNSKFVDALSVVKEFLDDNPRELVVFILEQYVASYDVIKELSISGLMAYCCYGHPDVSQPWPTVESLINGRKRLLLFSNRAVDYKGRDHNGDTLTQHDFGVDFVATTSVNWWHTTREYMATTAYAYTNETTMTDDCSLDRVETEFAITDFSETSQSPDSLGGAAYRLIVANHFISNPLPCEACAASANQNASLKNRMLSCSDRWGHQVNFPTVDFWSLGDIVAVCGHLNQKS